MGFKSRATRASAATTRRTLSRTLQPMSAEVRTALLTEGLLSCYEQRPAYQRNDYLGWINRAKRPETRQRRLDQMISELRDGGVYMKMQWRPGR